MNPIAKRSVTALSVAAAVVCAVLASPVWLVATVAAVFWLLAVAEYAALLAKKLDPAGRACKIWLLIGAAILAASLAVLPVAAAREGNLVLLFLLAVVKISDMGGFAFGVAFGRHKLCPSISPNKSWEGLAGSVFGSCLVSCLFMPVTEFPFAKAVLVGVLAALVGTAGDLVESKFKRWVGVKDSSAMPLTNGMGGILDMYDSLVFAPALVYAFV